jgi:hypothetical protein
MFGTAATAAAQSTANRETAITQSQLNMVDQNTPYGGLTYSQTGTYADGTPKFTATQTLNPTQQAALNAQQGIELDTSNLARDQIGRISQAVGQDFKLSDFGPQPVANADSRQQVIDSLMQQQTSRLDPRFAGEERDLRTRLANQGIAEGTEAYSNAMRDYNFGKNDAYQTAQNQAINAGGAEQSRQFGLESNAFQQQLANALTERNQPLNEMSALLGSGTGVQQPTYVSTPQTGVSATDVIGATSLSQNAAQNAYNQKMGSRNALIGALGSAAAGAAMASDRRLKKNIRRIGKIGPYKWYAYEYKGSDVRQVGVMAQEVLRIKPSAVVTMPNGFMAVKYGEL